METDSIKAIADRTVREMALHVELTFDGLTATHHCGCESKRPSAEGNSRTLGRRLVRNSSTLTNTHVTVKGGASAGMMALPRSVYAHPGSLSEGYWLIVWSSKMNPYPTIA